MPGFTTNPVSLRDLLEAVGRGEIQLPDFQRSWVWDEDRIQDLLASISQAFPVGALMTLETGGEVDFVPRPVQGAPASAAEAEPEELLLDGQQRMTSLYQTAMRREVVETETARHAKVKRWYYFDMRKSLDASVPRREAIVGVPEDRVLRTNFGKDIVLDLSTPEKEFEQMMFPINRIFDFDQWKDDFGDYWIEKGDSPKRLFFREFQGQVLRNFIEYQVPVITLDRATSKEAVCLVFEKVNTGGKALDAFELVTAMYAASGFRLREDWAEREARLKKHHDVLANLSSIDFLQAISLVHTLNARRKAEQDGVELPAVSATRQSLLKLPIEAYKTYADAVEQGFVNAARFLHLNKVYKSRDLPYQSQVTPLAAIVVELGVLWENNEVRNRLARWYWCGVLGELYGSATESRLARDVQEVPPWLRGQGPEPSTIEQATFDANRLSTMRTRLSAAYKGVSALLMKAGANDFRSGQPFDHTVFFEEWVDIHHIFPKAWCDREKIPASTYDSIINKTPLSYRTNRKLGGVAPSLYLARLEQGDAQEPAIARADLEAHLRSHFIEPDRLRADDFEGHMARRRESLLALIEAAMGKSVYRGEDANEPQEFVEPPEAESGEDEVMEAAAS